MCAMFSAESPVGKAVLDKDLRYVFINQTLADFNGRSTQSHIGRTVQEVLPDAFPTLEPLLRSVLDQGVVQGNLHVSVETPNSPGGLSEWEASYSPIHLPDGSVGGVYVQAVNLTAKLRAERALSNSEKHLRRVLDSLFAFVGVMQPDGTLIEANRAPLDAAGIQAQDVLGRPFWDTFWWNYSTDIQDWLRNAINRVAQGQVVREDVTVRMVGDTRMTLDFMLVPMRDDQDVITHLIASAIDISDRLADQHRIEAALRERTVLLQEVHHRVKNNLQIIASLLRLQSRTAVPEVQQALQDSQNRVMAMSLTHQLLYERNDYSALELGPYLKRLVGSLRDAHGDLLRRVQMRADAPDSGISIDLQQAVPVALVVNELLTNALKHGFPAGRAGEVVVSAREDAGQITITVSDTGVGLPDGASQGTISNLGFSLIGLLTEQLQATIQWPPSGAPGATFTLQLPLRALLR
ncbi:sensor histidine kinase [Comamonas aquatica]|uniref:sensor histidine kinase n=1 Tax=Comamonas aquatica TaxID=225991 RepID=UPI0004BA3222|nr:PAS domain-containing protein [Comamonas aquatica]